VPFSHPDFSFLPRASQDERRLLYCDGVNFEEDVPRGQDSNNFPLSDECFATLSFWEPPYDILDDQTLENRLAALGLPSNGPDEGSLLRYVSWRLETKGRFQTLPSFQALQFNTQKSEEPSGGTNVPAHIPVSTTWAFLAPEGVLEITHHEIPVNQPDPVSGLPINYIPLTAINQLVGKCNAYPLGSTASMVGVWPAGTLAMDFPSISRPYRMKTGVFAVDITYRFLSVLQMDTNRKNGAGAVAGAGGVNGIYRWDIPTQGPVFRATSRDGNTNLWSDGTLHTNDGTLIANPGNVGYGGAAGRLLFPSAINGTDQPADFANLFRPGGP
jgi:hypothetical protein